MRFLILAVMVMFPALSWADFCSAYQFICEPELNWFEIRIVPVYSCANDNPQNWKNEHKDILEKLEKKGIQILATKNFNKKQPLKDQKCQIKGRTFTVKSEIINNSSYRNHVGSEPIFFRISIFDNKIQTIKDIELKRVSNKDIRIEEIRYIPDSKEGVAYTNIKVNRYVYNNEKEIGKMNGENINIFIKPVGKFSENTYEKITQKTVLDIVNNY